MNTSGIKCISICMTVVGSQIYIHIFIASNGSICSTAALCVTNCFYYYFNYLFCTPMFGSGIHIERLF